MLLNTVHDFKTCLTRNTVAECIYDAANDLRPKLCTVGWEFQAYQIGMDESEDVKDTAQLAVFFMGVACKHS